MSLTIILVKISKIPLWNVPDMEQRVHRRGRWVPRQSDVKVDLNTMRCWCGRDMLQEPYVTGVLITMESPCRMGATEIRREKTKVLSATRLGHKRFWSV